MVPACLCLLQTSQPISIDDGGSSGRPVSCCRAVIVTAQTRATALQQQSVALHGRASCEDDVAPTHGQSEEHWEMCVRLDQEASCNANSRR